MSHLTSQLHTQLSQQAQQHELGCTQFPDAYFDSGEYPEQQSLNKLAIALCDACPIKDLCLAYALEAREGWGIWGGKTASQRKRMVTKKLKLAK